MSVLSYGFEKKLGQESLADGVRLGTEALQKEGFGVLTEIDVQDTLKKKLEVDFRPYVILGACNPQLARRALESEEYIGLLLPRNIVVQQQSDGSVSIAIADPKAMFRLVESRALSAVAEDAEARLRRVTS